MRFATVIKSSCCWDIIRGSFEEVLSEIVGFYYGYSAIKWDDDNKMLTISFDDPDLEDEIWWIGSWSDIRRV